MGTKAQFKELIQLVGLHNPRRIYCAGPMSGRPRLNFDAFDAARDFLASEGWEPVSPADIDRAWGVRANKRYAPPLQECLRRDFAVMCTCGAIAFLPGWETSEGANAELEVAKYLGLEMYDVNPKEHLFRQWGENERACSSK